MIWSFQGEMKKEEEEGERIKKLSMLGSDDVEGKREGEVEKVGWGNYNIGEGEGEGQEEGGGEGGGEEKRRAWLRHALLAPSVKEGRPRGNRLLMFELCFCHLKKCAPFRSEIGVVCSDTYIIFL